MSSGRKRTVAVLGASSDRRKFGNKGLRAFVLAGWNAIPVNSHETVVEGLPAVGSVADIAGAVDVVSFYVPAAVGVKVLADIAAKAPGELWLNPGSASGELLRAAADHGLNVRQLCSILELGLRPSDF